MSLARRLRLRFRAVASTAAEDESAALETLKEIGTVLSASGDFSAETRPLKNQDFATIGKCIQIYCFSDFNARRIIDTIRFAHTGKDEAYASRLNETDVLMHLKNCADFWRGPQHIGDGLRRAATTLQMHRIMRNNFAHWSMRRTANDEGFAILTMQAEEVKRRGLHPFASGEATWALMPVKHVLEEIEKLVGHGEYLAKLAAHLIEHRSELRALYAEKETG